MGSRKAALDPYLTVETMISVFAVWIYMNKDIIATTPHGVAIFYYHQALSIMSNRVPVHYNKISINSSFNILDLYNPAQLSHAITSTVPEHINAVKRYPYH